MPPNSVSADHDRRWRQRHPRLVATGISLIAGATATMLYILPINAFNCRNSNLLPPLNNSCVIRPEFFGFNIFVLLGSVWTFILWPNSRQSNPELSRSIFLGVVCATLPFPTIGVYASSLEAFSDWPNLILYNAVSLFYSLLLVPFVLSLFSLFIPQIVGGIGGYIVWRITRTGHR